MSGFLGGGIGPMALKRRAAADWWQVAGQTCVAAYQPIGAASLAASYVNLANPGTYDAAPGVAPTLAAGGWVFAGPEYLTTGIVQGSQAWSFFVRYNSVVTSNAPTPIGAYTATFRSEIHTHWFGASVGRANGGFGSIAPAFLSGVYGMAGVSAYRNGLADGTVAVNANTQTQAFEIGNLGGIRDGVYAFYGTIAAVAIYSTTLSAADVAALTTRMQALA